MRSLPEIVEMAAHKLGPIVSVYYLGAISESVVEKCDLVDFLAEGNDGKVDSAAASVAWLFGNITVWDDSLFIEVWVEFSLSFVILRLFAPTHEMVNSLLRSIGIVDN